jgi:2-polyprenyl-3-methyl-5-hydroxy-6-metoxy-1,4-benzoquinol methylase
MKLRWKIAQAAELIWWKNYLRERPVKAYLSAKKQYWQNVLDQIGIHPAKGNTILDAGCGPAGIFLVFDDHKIDAIDPLLDQYEASLPHFIPENHPKVNFIQCSLEQFKHSHPYDFIFCLNAINHVSDIHRSLDILFSALAPGGQLIISTDAHKHSWLQPIFKAIPGDILHPHQYNREEYHEMLLSRGGKIEKEFCLKKGNIFDYWLWVVSIDD